jgi:hypothetical protein
VVALVSQSVLHGKSKFNHICPSFLDHSFEKGTIRTSRS